VTNIYIIHYSTGTDKYYSNFASVLVQAVIKAQKQAQVAKDRDKRREAASLPSLFRSLPGKIMEKQMGFNR
jgi:hypothetical protein